jgi:hypothetical protein
VSAEKVLPEIAVLHHGKTLFGPMREWRNRKQVPPVLLLTGQPGIGKKMVAQFLAQWISCERNGFDRDNSLNGIKGGDLPESEILRPCGECPPCRKTLGGNGVDITEISSEADDEGSTGKSSSLKIEQFRKLKASVGFSAHDSRYKTILIPHADRMTTQAANSVLKLLEETPPGWIFFMTANDPTLLLPTVVSRCQVLRLKPFSSTEIVELLKNAGVPAARREISAGLSQGSWERALRFADDEIWEQRKVVFQFLEEPSRMLQSLVDWAAQEPKHFEVLVDLLEQVTADLIRWTASPQTPEPEEFAWVQSDGTSEIAQHAKQTIRRLGSLSAAQNFWLARAERLAEVRQESLAPLNRKILTQDLLLPWIGVSR